jgi:hypothetical protein
MNNSDEAHSYAGRADATGRRDFLTKAVLAGATVALSSVPLVGSRPQATPTTPGSGSLKLSGRRKFGSLEVSSVTGAPVGVQKSLMRHADIRTTMNVCGNAATEDMRQTNSKVVAMALRTA